MDYAVTVQTDVLLAGRYQIGPLLGSGGFGAVYLATDERLHRPVAIKVCSTRRLPPHEAAEAARLFQSEALTLARLRHPGLTAIWDYFHQDDDWYLVMEYVPGETLRSLLRRIGGPLPQAEAIDYTRQLCAVLGYLHRQQPSIVFRDLKPANIMVTPEGQLKLIDFGIARLFSPGKAADTAQFGTPGYAPPEQYGGQTEPRSDIYSLGVVLHQMLTGYSPSSSPFALPPVRALNAAIPEPIEALTTRATAYNIGDRVASAEEFCAALDAATARQNPALTVSVPRIMQPAHAAATGTTTGRQMWSPSPRALPTRPESHGMGRGIMLIILLMILLGSLGIGGYVLRSHIAAFAQELFKPVVARATPPHGELPALIVFSAISNGTENIYVRTSDGTVRPLTQLPRNVNATQPAISPDGKSVAFTKEITVRDAETKKAATTYEFWIGNVETGAERQLTLDFELMRAPAWSPDGEWLALEVADPGLAWKEHDIVLVNVNTATVRKLVTTPQWEGGPTWSPDGKRIAYQSRPQGYQCMQLFIVDADGAPSQQVTDLLGPQCQPRSSGAYWPDWSPDGSRIAFGRKIDGKEQLALLNVDSGDVQILDTGNTPAGYPRWSADGRHLLFEQGKNEDVQIAHVDLLTCEQTCDVQLIDTAQAGSHLADWK